MQKILEQLITTSLQGNQDSDAHLMSLFGIALSLRPKNILELGVRDGTTTLPFLAVAKLCGAEVHSVDLNPTTFNPPEIVASNWYFNQMDAIEFLEDAVEHKFKFDLVFVDDWHSYPHVKRELELINELVTPKSVVLLHDLMYDWQEPNYHSEISTNNPEWAGGGPYRAVNELDKSKWEFATIPRSNGLTILRKLA